MSEEAQENDRSESATPYKLRRARERGMVARGFDLGFAVLIGTFLLWLWFAGAGFAAAMQLASARVLGAGDIAPGVAAGQLFKALTGPLIGLGAMLFGVGLVADFLQVGPVFSAHPLKPDFTRLNPAKGLKRIFSWRALIEAGKGVLKLIAYGAIVWLVARRLFTVDLPGIVDAASMAAILGSAVMRLLASVFAMALVFAVFDQLLARRQFDKQMRMSRRDVRREAREREGEPRLKQRRRQVLREFMQAARSVGAVQGADIVVTNPTHYAVALRYRGRSMAAPRLVSKGRDRLAERIKRAAFLYNVPVVEDRVLARGLFRDAAFDAEIPARYFAEVAALYRTRQLVKDA
ncbi:MAG: EscU/YscU/HrcU family type III secretion system export apparatus switch protein [Proteobacteria bacterium]|nr:EscU/YscU/HrcU family type III secretion system export apparatus switch protein [Pseudomonadota bacterium]